MTSIDPYIQRNSCIRNAATGKKRSDPLPQLLTQMVGRLGQDARVVRTASRPWASALFEGRRHVVVLRLETADAFLRFAVFAEGLEDCEWHLSGHFVADLSIEDCIETGKTVTLELSALTIEDW